MPVLCFTGLVLVAFLPSITSPHGAFVNQITMETMETWWRDFTATKNLFGLPYFGHTWTISADLQLFIFSPLLLFALLKWRFRFVLCLCGTILLLNLSIFYTLLHNNSYRVEFSTLARASPWLVGLILGFLLQRSNDTSDVSYLSKSFVRVLWCVTGIIMFSCIYLYRFCNNGTFYAVYEPTHRTLWALCLSWIIFSCHYGYSVGVNNFLSHPCFKTVANLTYCAFLWHLPVQTISKCLERFPEYLNGFLFLRDAIANTIMSLMIAIPWSLMFELPFINLFKLVEINCGRKMAPRKVVITKSTKVYVY